MKTAIVVILTSIISVAAVGQGQSARLSGMGNLSIAVPDAESEALFNPAKATRLKGLLLRGNPFLSNYSSKREGSSTSSSGSSSYSTSSSNEIDNGVTLLPVDVLLSLGPLVLGGSAALSSNSYKNIGSYDQSYPSYRQTNQSEYETNVSGKTFTARGAFDLGILSVGGAASLINQSGESKGSSSSSYSGGTAGSSQSEYKNEGSGKNFQAGVLIGSPEQFEISVVAFLQNMDGEGKPTKIVYNGIPLPLDKPHVSFNKGSFSGLTSDIRHQLTESVLMGGRFSLLSSTSEMSEKSQWYDQGSSQPIYEERKTGNSEVSSYQFAAALTWQVTGTALLGLEFSLAPTTSTNKSFYTTSGTTSNNRRYNSGDVRYESTYEGAMKSLRLGGEIAVSENFTLRSGAQVQWITAESSSKDDDYVESRESKGQTSSTFYVSGGFSYNLGFIRIDYAIGIVPTFGYSGYYGPGPSYSPIQQDVMFQHYLTASILL
jgi:hypothetical protein